MSWLLEKKKDKYRFWSTIVDDWLTPWLTRDEALYWLERKYREYCERKIEEEREYFPCGWFSKDNKMYRNQQGGEGS